MPKSVDIIAEIRYNRNVDAQLYYLGASYFFEVQAPW